MNSKTFATILFKALAIYGTLIVLDQLRPIAMSIQAMFSQQSDQNNSSISIALILIIPYFVQIAFVILLWSNAEFMATRTAPEEGGQSDQPLESHQLYIVAFTIIGIFILIESLPTLFYQLANFWAIRNLGLGPKQAVQNYLSLISPMLKILLAAAIIFQGKGLIKLISHLRTIVDKKVDSRKVANGA